MDYCTLCLWTSSNLLGGNAITFFEKKKITLHYQSSPYIQVGNVIAD
jgi:hypothetical protein